MKREAAAAARRQRPPQILHACARQEVTELTEGQRPTRDNAGRSSVRHVVYDTNYWKSFIHARLAVPMGDPGCLSLFGGWHGRPGRESVASTSRGGRDLHRLLAEHLTAEYRVKTEGRGRTVDEWRLRADGRDNHGLDCLVGAAVAASIQGAVLLGTDARSAPRHTSPRFGGRTATPSIMSSAEPAQSPGS